LVLAFIFFQGPLAEANESFQIDFFNSLWVNVPPIAQACAENNGTCGLTDEELAAIKDISISHDKELKLEFKSARLNPGLFDPNSEIHRVAVTGDSIGDPVIINTDLFTEMKFFDIIPILFHELSHHYGFTDGSNRSADQIGGKLRKFSEQAFEVQSFEKYGQAHINLYLLSMEKIHFSVLLLTDGFSVVNIIKPLFLNFPCPAGKPDLRGVDISRLRIDPPLSWDRFNKEHAFSVTMALGVSCVNVGTGDHKAYNQFLAMNFVFGVAPIQGIPAKDFWKLGPVKLIPGRDGTNLVELGHAEFDRFFTHPISNALKNFEILNAPDSIREGEELEVSGRFTLTDSSVPLGDSCIAFISSDDFYGDLVKPRHRIHVEDCQISRVAGDRFNVRLKYRFPEGSPRRVYSIDQLLVPVKGAELFLGVYPKFRSDFEYITSNANNKIKFVSLGLFQQDSNRNSTVIEEDIDINKHQEFMVNDEDAFVLRFIFDTQETFTKESVMYTQMSWIHNQMGRRRDNFDIPVFLSEMGWNFPFNGGTAVVRPDQNNPDHLYFQLGLRPYGSGPGTGNLLDVAVFDGVWFLTESLNEYFLPISLAMTVDR